jgi:phosphatidate cytidylyltransferase
MLKQRLLTAAVLLPLLLAAMFLLPGIGWQLLLIVPVLIAAHEWARLAAFSHAGEATFLVLLMVTIGLAGMVAGAPAIDHAVGTTPARVVFGFCVAFWLIVVPCWLWLKLAVRNRWVLGICGIAVLVPTWLAFTQLQRNPLLLLLLLGVVWIADTAAYLFGRTFGRHKLAPGISPGKTWEGVFGALSSVTVYALILARATGRDSGFLVATFLGMTVFSIVGDLFESWLKRGAGVKDSGAILPGHGGMLDRIDGLMAAMPLAALIFI